MKIRVNENLGWWHLHGQTVQVYDAKGIMHHGRLCVGDEVLSVKQDNGATAIFFKPSNSLSVSIEPDREGIKFVIRAAVNLSREAAFELIRENEER